MPEGYITIFCCGAGVVIGFVLAAWGMFAVFLRDADDNAPRPKRHGRTPVAQQEPPRRGSREAADAEPAGSDAAMRDADNADDTDAAADEGIPDGGGRTTGEWDPWATEPETEPKPGASGPDAAEGVRGAQAGSEDATNANGKDRKRRRRKKRGSKPGSAASRLDAYEPGESWTSFTMDFGDEDLTDIEVGRRRQDAAYAATAQQAAQAISDAHKGARQHPAGKAPEGDA